MITNLKSLIIGNLIVIGLLLLLALSASAQITIPTPFTISLVAPPADVPLVNWQTINNFTQSTNNLSIASVGSGNGQTVSQDHIPSGAANIITFTAPTVNDGSRLGIAPTNAVITNNNQYTICIFSSFSGSSGKFVAIIGGSFFDDDILTIGSFPPMARLRMTGSLIYPERSIDGGVTWVNMNDTGGGGSPIPPVTQAAVIYYVKAFADAAPTSLLNILTNPALTP